ncbi:MAG: hypothetical protein QOD77_790 [Thermoplasmata archaeon]|nr:hypothetical protein [Thermoplasmata archaeon]
MIEEVRPGVVVVGTAHISATSVAEVESTIRSRRPAKVLVELDAVRRAALEDPEAWQRTDIFQVLKQKKQHLFMLQLYLGAMQAQMGRQTGVAPGAELLRALQVAHEVGAEVVLVDRDIRITLKRGFGGMGFWAKMRLAFHVAMAVFTPSKAGDAQKLDVDAMLQSDAITQMTEEFARFAPEIKVALIDERDAYMASHIHEQAQQAGPTGLVAVVGAGHMPGIRAHLAAPAAIPARATLDELPAPRLTVGKIIGWAIPILFVAYFVWLGVSGNYRQLGEEAVWFILITGGCSAIGCALALGHPLSILTAFAAAPIGVLHPLVATGWFAGLVEAKVRSPTVADFAAIKHMETMGQFLRNGVVRILWVTALTNLGAMVSTVFVASRIIGALGGG